MIPAPGSVGAIRHGIHAVLLLVSPWFIPPPEQSLPEPGPALTAPCEQEVTELSSHATLPLLSHHAGTCGGMAVPRRVFWYQLPRQAQSSLGSPCPAGDRAQ